MKEEFEDEYNFVMNCKVPPKKLRIKKICGRCEFWRGFPYVHCELDCDLDTYYIDKEQTIFDCKPTKPKQCKYRRQEQENMKCKI